MPVSLLELLLAPLDALGEEEPEDLAFLAFLDFFLAFGLVSAVASLAPEVDVPDVAAGELDEPDVMPEEPLLEDEGDEPEALLPVLPDAPDEVSLLPDALEPVLPLAPEVPDADEPGCGVLDGTELEVPLPPAMPASLPVPAPVAPVALCDLTVDDGLVALPLPDCARAMEDTEATTTSDRVRRVVFNVMSCSFINWDKGITDAAAWMQRLHPCSAVLTPRCGK